jgi:hypothetical protein
MLAKYFFIFVLLLLSLPSNTYAKLANLQYDIYIRKSDIIVEGTVISKIKYNDIVFFKLQVKQYYYGTDSNCIYLMSHTGKYWVEDQPEWHIGEKLVLFLVKKAVDDYNYFDCLYGYSSKIVLKGDHIESDFFHYKYKNDFIDMINTFTTIRTETDTNKNIVSLVNLLNSKDIRIIDGACDF